MSIFNTKLSIIMLASGLCAVALIVISKVIAAKRKIEKYVNNFSSMTDEEYCQLYENSSDNMEIIIRIRDSLARSIGVNKSRVSPDILLSEILKIDDTILDEFSHDMKEYIPLIPQDTDDRLMDFTNKVLIATGTDSKGAATYVKR